MLGYEGVCTKNNLRQSEASIGISTSEVNIVQQQSASNIMTILDSSKNIHEHITVLQIYPQ